MVLTIEPNLLTIEGEILLMNDELYSIRLAKLDKLAEKGIVPYLDKYMCSHTIQEAMTLPDGEEAKIAGRVMVHRVFGKLAFYD